jgi:glycosyltransferase involved in cell wall biosynthesis
MTESMTKQLADLDVPLVLHVIPTTVARGAQREARALADHLDDAGVRVHRVLSLFDGPQEVATDFNLGHPGGTAPAVGFDPRLVLKLRATIKRLDPTVVIAHGSEPLKYLAPAMFARRRPLAYYAIGTYSGSGRRSQLSLWKRLVSRADVVAAEGEEVREECMARLGVPAERVVLAPNGRDPEVFAPWAEPGTSVPERQESTTEPLVLFVGALTTGKRPGWFIEAVARLRSLGIPLRAELAGDGPLHRDIVDPAKAAGVELLGSRSDVADLMRRADVMVFPSLPMGEGMPGVLIEAGLSGLPVVATAAPGVRSIVLDGKTGYVVGPQDIEAMVAAIAQLLFEPERRTMMGRAAREYCVDNFSIEAVGARWMAILQPLLDHANGSRQ